MWKRILFSVLNGEENIQSPFAPQGIMQSLFVVVDKESRMGYLWIWCSVTYKGINMSRMIIPENVKSVSSKEVAELNIPNIHFVDPSEDGGGL